MRKLSRKNASLWVSLMTFSAGFINAENTARTGFHLIAPHRKSHAFGLCAQKRAMDARSHLSRHDCRLLLGVYNSRNAFLSMRNRTFETLRLFLTHERNAVCPHVVHPSERITTHSVLFCRVIARHTERHLAELSRRDDADNTHDGLSHRCRH